MPPADELAARLPCSSPPAMCTRAGKRGLFFVVRLGPCGNALQRHQFDQGMQTPDCTCMHGYPSGDMCPAAEQPKAAVRGLVPGGQGQGALAAQRPMRSSKAHMHGHCFPMEGLSAERRGSTSCCSRRLSPPPHERVAAWPPLATGTVPVANPALISYFTSEGSSERSGGRDFWRLL